MFIGNQVRYHCPTIVVLKFTKAIPKTYKRRIWSYEKANFNLFRNLLTEINWDVVINKTDLDSAAEAITQTLIEAAQQAIPNKIATIRQNDYPWINGYIRKLIRKRKRLSHGKNFR